jgi:uncharacterized phage protein (TIGR02220 family)
MSIIRVEKKTKGFSVIDNAPFEDKQLTWGAKGLIGYLLTKPDNWQIRMQDLHNSSPQGEHAVKSLVKELILKGYILRQRTKDKNGKFRWVYVVFERPTIPQFSIDGRTTDGGSTDGKTIDGKVPDIVNTNIPNTDIHTVEQSPTECADPLEVEKEIKRKALCADTETGTIKTKVSKPKKEADTMVKQVMDYLIEKSGKNLQPNSKSALSYIPARIKEGNGWAQFKAVIDYKVQEWGEDGKEIRGKPASFYLRPETLFTSENFSKYLEEAREAYRLSLKQPKQTTGVVAKATSLEQQRREWGGE